MSHHVEMEPWWKQMNEEMEKSLDGTVADDEVIFHYTSSDTLKEILKSGNIRLGPLSQTNDPLERRKWTPFILYSAPGGAVDLSVQRSIADQVEAIAVATDHHLRRGVRLACFCQDQEPSMDSLPGSHFHRGWARARMWDQYGRRHSGACLVFKKFDLVAAVDEGIVHEDGDLFIPGNVVYRDVATTTVLEWEQITEHGIQHVLDQRQTRRDAAAELYLRKVRDWESEQEYRIVYVRWNPPVVEVDEPMDVPFQSTLAAVILGEVFSDDENLQFREHLKRYPDVEVWRCRWSTGVPTLTRE